MAHKYYLAIISNPEKREKLEFQQWLKGEKEKDANVSIFEDMIS